MTVVKRHRWPASRRREETQDLLHEFLPLAGCKDRLGVSNAVEDGELFRIGCPVILAADLRQAGFVVPDHLVAGYDEQLSGFAARERCLASDASGV
jgi:hypothetical protein